MPDDVPTDVPTSLPTGLPTGLPTDVRPALERALAVAWAAVDETQLDLPDHVAALSPGDIASQVDSARATQDFATAYEIVDSLEQSATAMNQVAMARIDGARQMRFPAFCSGARLAEERVKRGEESSSADLSLASAYRAAVCESKVWVGKWCERTLPAHTQPTSDEDGLLRTGFAARALAQALQLAAKMAAKQDTPEDAARWTERIVTNVRTAAGSAYVERWLAKSKRS